METIGVLVGHAGPVLAVRFNNTGHYCMTGSTDRTIKLWSPSRSAVIQNYEGPHNYEVLCLDISGDNSRFVSGGGDKLVFSWDVTTGKVISKYQGHNARVRTVAYNMQGNVIMSGSEDASAKIWDTRSHSSEPIQTLNQFKDTVISIKSSRDQIVAGSLDGVLRTFDIRCGALYIDNLKEPIISMEVSRDDSISLTSHSDGVLKIIDRLNGEVLSSYSGAHVVRENTLGCGLSEDNNRIVTGSEDGSVVVYETIGGRIVKGVGHSAGVVGVSTHPKDKDVILSASFDCSCRLWKIASS
jgi:mitogen-activated protein kinase organizer 1